jgi:hypothetical protein
MTIWLGGDFVSAVEAMTPEDCPYCFKGDPCALHREAAAEHWKRDPQILALGATVAERPGDHEPQMQAAWDRLHEAGFVRAPAREDCPECGVAYGEPHRGSCFFLTGDPADLLENRG